jgi:hypothetical protein
MPVIKKPLSTKNRFIPVQPSSLKGNPQMQGDDAYCGKSAQTIEARDVALACTG